MFICLSRWTIEGRVRHLMLDVEGAIAYYNNCERTTA